MEQRRDLSYPSFWTGFVRPGCIPRCWNGDFRRGSTDGWSSTLLGLYLGPSDGLCVMEGQGTPSSHGMAAAPREEGQVPHWALRWEKDAVLQGAQEICFHAYSAITKRRDEALTPLTSVGRRDPTERKRRNPHSFILLSSCSHTNLNICFLFSLGPIVTALFLGVSTAADAHSRAAETSSTSDSPRSPSPFARLSQLDIIVTVFWKQRIGCI